jgi:hypothetical protein
MNKSRQSLETVKWPELQPLESELPPVAPFSEGLLPDTLRARILDVAERMQVPVDYPAAVMLVVLGGAIGRRAIIQPKAKDSEWVEVPNTYGAIIGPPSDLKSPVIQQVVTHVEKVETEWHGNAQYVDLAIGQIATNRPPSPRRVTVNDVTFEKLQELMSVNPLGMIEIRDELTGLLASFERKGHEGERQFYLTAWNGYSPYTIDRIKRGTTRLPHCCLSVIGGIQPNPLREYLTDLHNRRSYSDGMIQRFQLIVWPDRRPDYKYVDRHPDSAAAQKVQAVFDRILQFAPDAPLRFKFAPDAQEVFVSWYKELERRLRQEIVDPNLNAHLGKYRGLMPALSLIFHIAERVANGSVGFVGLMAGTPESNPVSLEHALLAVRWCEYLESHARRVYSVFSPRDLAAQSLGRRIRQREVGANGVFTCRDIYVKGWSGLKEPDDTKTALQVLETKGWIRPLDSKPSSVGGRPSDRYEVNPKVWTLSDPIEK